MRMFAPLGRNAQQCYDSYGVFLHSIQAMCKKLARSMFYRNLDQPELDKIQSIKELLCVKYGLICLLSFDVSRVDFMLESLCDSFAIFLPTFHLYFLYDFYNKYITFLCQS